MHDDYVMILYSHFIFLAMNLAPVCRCGFSVSYSILSQGEKQTIYSKISTMFSVVCSSSLPLSENKNYLQLSTSQLLPWA